MSQIHKDVPEDKIAQIFYRQGAEFFSWNSVKNTPNILHMVATNTEKLETTLAKASASSDRLAEALNRLTRVGVIISSVSLLVAGAAVALEIVKFLMHK
jgi:hypothetical protein